MGFQSKASEVTTPQLLEIPNISNGYYQLHGNLIHKTAAIDWDGIELGQGNKIGPFCTIGGEAEHKFYVSEGKIKIGNNNVFHNGVSVSKPTRLSKTTMIGNNCTFMSSSVIHHDSIIEDDVIVSSNVSVGGGVIIMRGANIGMNATIHQFKVIGAFSMIGMQACVIKGSVAKPGRKLVGVPLRDIGPNKIGLSRSGITDKILQLEVKRFESLENYLGKR
jgi:UDP-N-acetylglucosamine acyltransferase